MPDSGLASAAALSAALFAVYLLLNERSPPPRKASEPPAPRDARQEWMDTQPPRSSSRADAVDPLDFTPDLKSHVDRLVDRVARKSGNTGGVREAQGHLRRFAKIVFRSLGRRPGRTSAASAAQALDNLVRIRAEAVNAVLSLYVCVHQPRALLVVDEVAEAVMRDTAAYIRAVRAVSGGRTYTDGRFPSPWDESRDPDYDMI